MSDTPDYGRLYQGVIPYIAVENAIAAIEFYRKAFGAKLHGEAMKDEQGVVMNATLEINGGIIMLMDHMDNMGSRKAVEGGHPFTMQIVTDNGQQWFDRAVDAGCTVTMPFAPQFWGDTYGRLLDPFGIEWAVNEPSAESMAQTEALAAAAR
ncbi:MAG: VOC family protein [Gemmatimonadota bacterium]